MTADSQLILLAIVAISLIGVIVVILRKMRITPEERELRRCEMVNRIGRLTDGMLTDVTPDAVYFVYSVMGVDYETSQDVSAYAGSLPDDRDSLVGPVGVKYSPRNPANSIVYCESWSGLRARKHVLT